MQKKKIAKQTKPTTITEYISTAPEASRARLRQMRAIVRAAAPKAKEGTKWSMASLSDEKRILVMFGGFKHHIGFYPTARGVAAFEKELSKYNHARGSIQFPHDEPLPVALIKKITAFRVKDSKEQDKKWRS